MVLDQRTWEFIKKADSEWDLISWSYFAWAGEFNSGIYEEWNKKSKNKQSESEHK